MQKKNMPEGFMEEEVITVFEDKFCLNFYDPDVSEEKKWYLIIGESKDRNLLVVSYSERHDKVRILAARRATKKERQFYEKAKYMARHERRI